MNGNHKEQAKGSHSQLSHRPGQKELCGKEKRGHIAVGKATSLELWQRVEEYDPAGCSLDKFTYAGSLDSPVAEIGEAQPQQPHTVIRCLPLFHPEDDDTQHHLPKSPSGANQRNQKAAMVCVCVSLTRM